MSAPVDLWRIAGRCPDADLATLRAVLSTAERARADAFVFARDRDRYAVFRGAMRQILGQYLGQDPAQVALAIGPHGKPHLAGGGLHFNLSHSGDVGLLALSHAGPVGVDLEATTRAPDHDRLAVRVLSGAERVVFDALPPAARAAAFLRAWTRKEAYLKATGEGLSFSLQDITVTLAPGDPPRIVAIKSRPDAASHWSLHDLAPGGGTIGTLAAPPSATAPRWFDHGALAD